MAEEKETNRLNPHDKIRQTALADLKGLIGQIEKGLQLEKIADETEMITKTIRIRMLEESYRHIEWGRVKFNSNNQKTRGKSVRRNKGSG